MYKQTTTTQNLDSLLLKKSTHYLKRNERPHAHIVLIAKNVDMLVKDYFYYDQKA